MVLTKQNLNSLTNLTYRIPIGSIPWNKGKKYNDEILEKMRTNQVLNKCEVCESDYRIKKSHAHLRRSCSRVCGGVIKSIEKSGTNHPMWGKENLSVKGSKNVNWKGGITQENKALRNSTEFKHWRLSVFNKDNFTCQKCMVKGGRLEAHHIKPFSIYKELRFKLDNGITLCKPCHKETDSYGSKIINYIKNLNK